MKSIASIAMNRGRSGRRKHYENMPMQSYRDFLALKIKTKNQLKKFDMFLIFAPKHRLWVHVRTAPHRGGSNEYPQCMFWSKKKEK